MSFKSPPASLHHKDEIDDVLKVFKYLFIPGVVKKTWHFDQ